MEFESVVSLEELQARLEWTLDADEERIAMLALERLSDEAAAIGDAGWVTPQSTPNQVKRIIIAAAARWLRNPDLYATSRAGDEGVGWHAEHIAGDVEFSASDRNKLAVLGNRTQGGRLYSVPVVAHGVASAPRTGYVPTAPVPGLFPFFGGDSA